MSKVLHPQDWDPQNLVYPMNVSNYFGEESLNGGLAIPADWQKSIDTGETATISKMYADHYKIKILTS